MLYDKNYTENILGNYPTENILVSKLISLHAHLITKYIESINKEEKEFIIKEIAWVRQTIERYF